MSDGYDKMPVYVKETLRDGTKVKKRITCQEIPYEQFQMHDFNDSSNPIIDHMSHDTPPDQSPELAHQSTEADVREIRRYIRQLMQRVNQKEERSKINREWTIVALVLDRLFFFIYLSVIVVSISAIFPKAY